MAYFTRKQYAAKYRYARQLCLSNMESIIEKGMPKAEAELLARIVSLRHELHHDTRGNAKQIVCPESVEGQKLIEIIETLQSWLGRSVIDVEELPSDYDWYYILDDEDKQEYDGVTDYVEQMVDNVVDQLHYLNREIEKKLKSIDIQYGTSFCPTGIARQSW